MRARNENGNKCAIDFYTVSVRWKHADRTLTERSEHATNTQKARREIDTFCVHQRLAYCGRSVSVCLPCRGCAKRSHSVCIACSLGTGRTSAYAEFFCVCIKWPSHTSVWTLRMPAYDDFLSFVVIRWCTSAARREVVERAFRARCHTHSYVGARCVRWEILCMHKNSLRMPTYGLYAASTICTRYANVPRVRGTVPEVASGRNTRYQDGSQRP